ncbi:LysR family transcriptional regulator substrate-binding protein [Numidum massiliense]|uniref:LysR family transcriptional regulator substrate-binding protein n=1 Tax=Numidum massiliense TaxID=1522315 RepID=UPI0006D54781|nr:LysR family transcriptional regulator substrate-binding protein [Numidum massiliense]
MFIEKAVPIVKAHDDLLREMRDGSEEMGAELAIGVPPVTGGHVLPPTIQAFSEKYPQVSVQLIEESPAAIEKITERGLVDFSILPLPLESSRLDTRPMLTEPLLLALPRMERHWMSEDVRRIVKGADVGQAINDIGVSGVEDASNNRGNRVGTGVSAVTTGHGRVLPMASVAGAPFILLKQGFGFRRVVLDLCAESGYQPHVAFVTSNIQTAQSLVAAGLGVTLVPRMVVRHDSTHSPLYVSLDTHPTRTLVFAYSEGSCLSLAARKFMDVSDKVGCL